LVRPRDAAAAMPTGFAAAFRECFGAVLPALPKRRGRRPRVPLAQVLPALVFHFMNAAGTLAEHFAQLFDEGLCDSSLSERRTRLPWEVFAELMRLGLRPLARSARHPDAFWRSWRLIALDGTQFSLTNTPQIKATIRKAKSRRGRAAFAKITAGVLLELGLHNPLAAAIGRGGQSEWALALELLAQLPARALLLADRLHGCAAFVASALAACEKVGGHFLIRARTNLRGQTIKRLKDGSRRVRVPVRQKGKPRVITQWLELREIRGRVQRPGYRAKELRLWTSLLDPQSVLPGIETAVAQERGAAKPHARNRRAGNRGGSAGQRAAGARAGAGGTNAGAARELRQDAGTDAAPVADPGAGWRFVERAAEARTDGAIAGMGWALCHTPPAPAAQLSARGAATPQRLAAPPPQSIVGRPGAFQTPLTMNSRKALDLS
jgi:hypothetical protein